MRFIIAVACAAGLFALATTAQAAKGEPMHQLGGPIKMGKYCWASTDGINGIYGYWNKCPKMKKAKKKRAAKPKKK